MAERTAIIEGNPVKYNDCNSNQVYAVIKQAFPDSDATGWTPEMVWPYLPTGSDAEHWCQKTLPNAKYNLNKPKRRRRQRGPGKAPPKHNPAEAVARRATTDSLFDK